MSICTLAECIQNNTEYDLFDALEPNQILEVLGSIADHQYTQDDFYGKDDDDHDQRPLRFGRRELFERLRLPRDDDDSDDDDDDDATTFGTASTNAGDDDDDDDERRHRVRRVWYFDDEVESFRGADGDLHSLPHSRTKQTTTTKVPTKENRQPPGNHRPAETGRQAFGESTVLCRHPGAAPPLPRKLSSTAIRRSSDDLANHLTPNQDFVNARVNQRHKTMSGMKETSRRRETEKGEGREGRQGRQGRLGREGRGEREEREGWEEREGRQGREVREGRAVR